MEVIPTMVNIAKVLKGGLIFFFGMLYTIITYYWIPAILDVVTETGTLSTTVTGILWMGLIITWIMLVLVLPGITIANGLQEE